MVEINRKKEEEKMKKLMSLILCLVILASMPFCALAADGVFAGEGAGKGGMITVEEKRLSDFS